MCSMHKFLECTDDTVLHYQCSEFYIYDTFAYECPCIFSNPAKHSQGDMQCAVCFCTVSGPPNMPTLTELRANSTSLYLSWEEPADNNAPILMYQITLRVMENQLFSVLTSNITELYVTDLTPFTVYTVQVVAVNSAGYSPPSEVMTVMTEEGSECISVCINTPVLFMKWLCFCWLQCSSLVIYSATFYMCICHTEYHI